MRISGRWFKHPVMSRDEFLLEIQNSILSAVVGTVFFWGWVTEVDIYTKRPDIYQYMDWVGSWFWGLIFVAAGVAHLASLKGEFNYMRKHIVLFKGFLWTYVGFCVLSGDLLAVSGWLYMVFALFALRTFLKVQVQRYVPPSSGYDTSKPQNVGT